MANLLALHWPTIDQVDHVSRKYVISSVMTGEANQFNFSLPEGGGGVILQSRGG